MDLSIEQYNGVVTTHISGFFYNYNFNGLKAISNVNCQTLVISNADSGV